MFRLGGGGGGGGEGHPPLFIFIVSRPITNKFCTVIDPETSVVCPKKQRKTKKMKNTNNFVTNDH